MRCIVQNGLMRTAEVSSWLAGLRKSLVVFVSVPVLPSTPPSLCPNLSTFRLKEALQENLGILPQDPQFPQAGSSWDKANHFPTLPPGYHLAQQRTRPRQGQTTKKHRLTQLNTPTEMCSGRSSVTHCHGLPYREGGSVCPNVRESDPPKQPASGAQRKGP